jgi:hypothetical protein
LEDVYRRFTAQDSPQVRLETHYGDVPDLEPWELVFESGGVWRLYQQGDRWAISLHSPVMGEGPYQVAILDRSYQSGDIFTSARHFSYNYYPFPLRYPLAELLMVNLLCRGRGMIVHAAAVADGEQGLLFAGTSGAGKSTISRLWQSLSLPGVELLSDDRVILRQQEGQIMMYGTPWHGDAQVVSPFSVPLKRVFILRQALTNRASRLTPVQAASSLLVRAFPPFWDVQGMQYTLEFVADICQSLPCYELEFLPDASMVDTVRCLNEN